MSALTTIADEIDTIQTRLHDDAVLWTRTQLLHWYNDGYRRLVTEAGSTRRFYVFNVPPRVGAAGSFTYEDRHANGTFRKFSKSALGGTFECSFEWEIEQIEGATPTNSNDCITQLWELSHAGGVIDDHYRFFLPKSHERIIRAAWDDKRMFGTTDKDLDETSSRWWQQEGEPIFRLRGLDKDKTFEVFDIHTTYEQNWSIRETETGTPRLFSGDRTYGTDSKYLVNDYAYTSDADISAVNNDVPYPGEDPASASYSRGAATGLGWRITEHDAVTDFDCTYGWEVEFLAGETETNASYLTFTSYWETEYSVFGYGDLPFGEEPYGGGTAADISFAIGVVRAMTSPDRQYLPMAYDTGELALLGTVREFQSSKDAISIFETISHVRELDEEDAPGLIPIRMYKYLRFYVWALAFGHQGEGQRPTLAKHYLARFGEGVALLKLLGNLTNKDRTYARGDVPLHGVPPMRKPRLPATYPRIEY